MADFIKEYGPILVPSLLLAVSEFLGSSKKYQSNGILHFISLFLAKWVGGKK